MVLVWGYFCCFVGPNGDGFGGQAFMEHYSDYVSLMRGWEGVCTTSVQFVMHI
jgi:hypothetical protein